MNKIALNNTDEDKKIITFTISPDIKLALNETLKNSSKYNLKKKSDWINEAISMLEYNPDYEEMVRNGEGNSGGFVFDKVYMTFQQRCRFAELKNNVVRAFPDIKGPQASIIRTAILSRLMRKT